MDTHKCRLVKQHVGSKGQTHPAGPLPLAFSRSSFFWSPPSFSAAQAYLPGGGVGRETHAVIFFQVKRKVKTKTKPYHGHFLGRFMPRTCEKVSTYTVSFSLRCLLENIPMMLCPLDSTKPATCFVSGLLLAQRGGDGLGPHLGHWCEQVSSFVLLSLSLVLSLPCWSRFPRPLCRWFFHFPGVDLCGPPRLSSSFAGTLPL